jgi:gamma-glutamyl hydrolase
MLTSENDTILDGNLDAFNLSLPLNFTLESATSRLYSHAPRKILRCLREKPITMNSHKFGIGISKWYQTEKISSFYRMLSTNFDRQGFEFVSSMEAIKYPFYGVQFHPEKNIFSYGEYENGVAFEDIDHSMEAIEAGQYFGNFFIQEARQNENYFFDPVMERQALIYNYQTSNLFFPFITEVYLFDVEHPMVANITTTSTAHHAAMDFLKSKINKMTTW